MTAIEYYVLLTKKADVHLKNDEADEIRAIDPATRAEVGGYFLNDALNNNIPLTTTCCNIAYRLFPKHKYPPDQVKMGWSVLRPLYTDNLFGLERESNRAVNNKETVRANLFKAWKDTKQNAKVKGGDRTPKMFRELDSKRAQDFLFQLFLEVDNNLLEDERNKIFNHKPQEWTGFRHEDFGSIITNANKRVKEHFHGRKIKPVLDAVNKLQSTPFFINESVLERLKMDRKAIEELILESSDSKESFKSKMSDLNEVLTRSEKHLGKEVYSSIYLDTRGRTYYGANYLSRSGNDFAKGLLMVEPEAIGVKGYDNLLVAAVDFRAKNKQEKMSRAEKLAIAENDVDEFIAVANGANFLTFVDDNGKVKKVDEPTQFLAVCLDIRNSDLMGSDFAEYKSGVLLSRDASQSGPMLMGIATQDHNTMKYTNVLESTKRHDLYEELGSEMLKLLKELDVPEYKGDIDKLDFGSDQREAISMIYDNEKSLASKAKRDFLELFENDPAALRDWSKYPLMLFGYSAEQWCIANDLWTKKQNQYSWLTPVGCKMLADLFYEAAKYTIPAVYQFMEGLKTLGSEVHKKQEDLLVHAAYSNFPFMQNYYKNESVKQEIMGKSAKDNGGKKEVIGLRVAVETDKRNCSKTKSGTPANSIHSIDSDLLKMVVNNFPHSMATNHDAFFATASRIEELDVVLRECTLKLGTNYDLLGNITNNYNLTPEDLGIKINPIDPLFNPMKNEYCYS